MNRTKPDTIRKIRDEWVKKNPEYASQFPDLNEQKKQEYVKTNEIIEVPDEITAEQMDEIFK